MINFKHEDSSLEKRLGYFLTDHPKEYPTQASFIKQAIIEKLDREEKPPTK
jgi:hypothetical protein